MKPTLAACFVLLGLLACPYELTAQSDWPHWMGPTRDNVWNEKDLMGQFPPNGPKVLWRSKVGIGYAGPAVASGRVVVMDFRSNSNVKVSNFERREFNGFERVVCFDESSGEELWDYEYPARYTISYPSGPRCTPIIEGERVYTLGAEGNLICLELGTGKVVWKKAIKEEYKTKSALWGYSAHPLLEDGVLYTLAGGKGTHIVALNANTGKEIWRSMTVPEQGYAPPTIIETGGVRQLITFTATLVAALDLKTGKVLWQHPYKASQGSVIMTPQLIQDKYLYVAGYNRQSLLLEINGTPESGMSATKVWANRGNEVISPVNVQPFHDRKNAILYGMDQSGELRAVQFPEGKKLWGTSVPVSKRRVGNGTAFLVRVADSERFVIFNDGGELLLADINPEGYREISRAKVIKPSNNAFNRSVVWSMPAMANQHVYVRNDEELICIDLAK